MGIWKIAGREIAYRRVNLILALFSVAVAVGSLVWAVGSLRAYDRETKTILEERRRDLQDRLARIEEQTRSAMNRMGFNIVVLPKDQNLSDWYSEDYASKFMDEDYLEKLSDSEVVTVEHIVGRLRQRAQWPETKWTVLLVGTSDRIVNPVEHAEELQEEPLARGNVLLGHEVHRGLDLESGDKIKFMGREFTVAGCRRQEGDERDMTVWMNLREAQELLDKKGLINEIVAVECRTAWADLPKVRSEISDVLPDIQVIEKRSNVLAKVHALTQVEENGKAALKQQREHRMDLRRSREHFALIVVPLLLVFCSVWLMGLTWRNIRSRKVELGVYHSIGFGTSRILRLFVARYVVIALIGGSAGFVSAFLLAALSGESEVFDLGLFAFSLAASVLLCTLACFVPVMSGLRLDPAEVLRPE